VVSLFQDCHKSYNRTHCADKKRNPLEIKLAYFSSLPAVRWHSLADSLSNRLSAFCVKEFVSERPYFPMSGPLVLVWFWKWYAV
jgi:hypothetical protein